MENEREIQLVTFKLKDEEFGVDVLKVERINPMTEITKVPRAPEYLLGVVNRMGQIIPIIDLRVRLGFESREADRNTRVIDYKLGDTLVGFVVDEVTGVKRISKEIIEPPPPIIAGIESEYIKGVGKLETNLIILLDLDKLLTPKELQRVREIAK